MLNDTNRKLIDLVQEKAEMTVHVKPVYNVYYLLSFVNGEKINMKTYNNTELTAFLISYIGVMYDVFVANPIKPGEYGEFLPEYAYLQGE